MFRLVVLMGCLTLFAPVVLSAPIPTTYVVHIQAPLEHSTTLSDLGMDVDRCTMNELHVYASQADLNTLDSLGYTYTLIETQPNPPDFSTSAKGLGTYHSYTSLTTDLQTYATNYPGITRLVNIGNSVQGKAMWALKITDNPDTEEAEPEFKYISSMHGDEIIGVEMCMYLIEHLLTSYGLGTAAGLRATALVDSTEIWIMPLMNPDGHTLGQRYNANTIDLNRDFPSFKNHGASGNIFDGTPLYTTGRQIETLNVMHWSTNHSFVLSANMHGGALVVNYPLDESALVNCNAGGVESPSHDDSLFIDVSTVYAQSNTPMANNNVGNFTNGIVNGTLWYSNCGGMQDWNYRYLACNEVTLELSNAKGPAENTIPTFWSENQESLLAYMESVHIGIRGLVSNSVTGDPVYAKITITGNSQPVFSDPDVGDYYRMLLPGAYTVNVEAQGYAGYTVAAPVTVVGTTPTVLDLPMVPLDTHSADQDQSDSLSLQEILRVIQLFNMGAVNCDGSSEDGYTPEAANQFCVPHRGDYDPVDHHFNLSEVLRMVQLYNFGAFYPCIEGEDGFCLGIAP